jgi:hypothetical protein
METQDNGKCFFAEYRDRLRMNPVYELEGVREQEPESPRLLLRRNSAVISEFHPVTVLYSYVCIEGIRTEKFRKAGITEGTSKSNLSSGREILQNKLKSIRKLSTYRMNIYETQEELK